MKLINLKTNLYINFKSWKFPGGEVGIKIDDKIVYPEVKIVHRIQNSDDLMYLLMATNALRNKGVKKISLFLPYVPYARQDRVMIDGDSLSIKVFADIINSQNYEQVEILDPHSDVTPALINNVQVEDNLKFASWSISDYIQNSNGNTSPVLVSPDAGAVKKIGKLRDYINLPWTIVTGQKHRQLSTGKITHTSIDKDVTGNTCFIVDDICDGGRTFIELGKVLKEKGAKDVILIVTHGIFSQGFQVFSDHISSIYTTNSFQDFSEEEKKNNSLKVYNML